MRSLKIISSIVFFLVGTIIMSSTTTTTASKPPASKKRYSSPYHNDFVDTHNAIRAEVGVGPMSWNETIAAYARNYANNRVKNNCEFEHSGGPYGENLAEGYGEMSGQQAVKYWATEKPNYDYGSNSCVGGECGHYTQIVWRNSIHLGCARANCGSGLIFVICSYDPPGNYIGERPY